MHPGVCLTVGWGRIISALFYHSQYAPRLRSPCHLRTRVSHPWGKHFPRLKNTGIRVVSFALRSLLIGIGFNETYLQLGGGPVDNRLLTMRPTSSFLCCRQPRFVDFHIGLILSHNCLAVALSRHLLFCRLELRHFFTVLRRIMFRAIL